MKRAILIILPLAIICAAVACQPILKGLAALYFSRQLAAEVRIEKALWNFKDKFTLNSVSINNKRGLECTIKSAVINYDIISILRNGINFRFNLEDVKLSYPESNVINDIAKALSVEQMKLLSFDYAKGHFYHRGDETTIKSLDAAGKHIKLLADGTIQKGSKINYNMKIYLSGEVVASVPESVRNVFFKQDGAWSEVSLYLSGDIKRPSINFSTGLFKLTVK